MFWWTIIIIVAFWLIIKKNNSNNDFKNHSYGTNGDEEKLNKKKYQVTEDDLYSQQIEFEERISQSFLPDSVGSLDVYTYKSLMRVWFKKLSGENRYNTETMQGIRNDFSDYMEALDRGATQHYLYMEAGESEKSKNYKKEAHMYARKAIAIEDGFAALLGDKEIEDLEKTRKINFDKINSDGELAPKGFIFGLGGELKKEG